MADGVYRTDDMALATVLSIAGHVYEIVRVTQRKALWVFTPSPEKEEEFDDLIADYEEWTAKVEPRQFTLRMAEIRREVIDVVSSRPVAPAA